MGYVLNLVFALVLSFNASAAVVNGGTPSINFGAVNGTSACLSLAATDTSYFSLHAFREASSTNGIRAFFKWGVQYQVPAGYRFRVACVAWRSSAANYTDFQLMSGTTANSGAPGGTQVFEFGATSIYGWSAVAAGSWYSMPYVYEWTSSVYPGIQGSTAESHEVIVVGREVPN